jgi:hypothetical protein
VLTNSYGTFVFNGLLSPLSFKPPPSVHLPHEPELEETGEVPAAAGQGRAGYDVVPDHAHDHVHGHIHGHQHDTDHGHARHDSEN